MIKIDFKYAAAKNFLCYGPEGIEIDFRNYGNIVLIRGENLDVQNEEERIASNGVGKSSLPEILVYALFGKTIKHPKKITHKNVINNKTKKNLSVEVQWGDFKVIRTRKPDSLQLWENGVELTLGGMPATQELILDKLGMTYETFVNIFIFTDNNAGAFLECDAEAKRKFVENLLLLDKYRVFNDASKTIRNKYKDTINTIGECYKNLLAESAACEQRIATYKAKELAWVEEKKAELKNLFLKLDLKKIELSKSNIGVDIEKYNKAQEEITSLNLVSVEYEQRKDKVTKILETVNLKLEQQREQKNRIYAEICSKQSTIKNLNKQISEGNIETHKLHGVTGQACSFCKGIIKKENYELYVDKLEKEVEIAKQSLEEENSALKQLNADYAAYDDQINTLLQHIGVANEKIRDTNATLRTNGDKIKALRLINKPESGTAELLIESQIADLTQNIQLKEVEVSGQSPFFSIIEMAIQELEDKKQEVIIKNEEFKKAEAMLPYYDFWLKAFGDNGIRKFVIDGIIPALNARCNYWLQHLIDGRIQIHFDNQLEETIQRNPIDGDAFVYAAMSGGERRRLCLAVCNAFAYIMMLSSGRTTSCIFLDEVTTNIDPIGVVGVYNMILEMAKDRQVFITTHDQGLLDMLEGCEVIKLQKKEGFTTLAKAL
jgi:DNA repair exonuclease SbcCD ATPase subunit